MTQIELVLTICLILTYTVAGLHTVVKITQEDCSGKITWSQYIFLFLMWPIIAIVEILDDEDSL